MPCETVRLPGGGVAIVCSSVGRRRRCACGRPAVLLCDWKTPTPRNRTKTCDRPLCEACSTKPAPDKDLCPEHARAWEAWRAKQRSESPS